MIGLRLGEKSGGRGAGRDKGTARDDGDHYRKEDEGGAKDDAEQEEMQYIPYDDIRCDVLLIIVLSLSHSLHAHAVSTFRSAGMKNTGIKATFVLRINEASRESFHKRA